MVSFSLPRLRCSAVAASEASLAASPSRSVSLQQCRPSAAVCASSAAISALTASANLGMGSRVEVGAHGLRYGRKEWRWLWTAGNGDGGGWELERRKGRSSLSAVPLCSKQRSRERRAFRLGAPRKEPALPVRISHEYRMFLRRRTYKGDSGLRLYAIQREVHRRARARKSKEWKSAPPPGGFLPHLSTRLRRRASSRASPSSRRPRNTSLAFRAALSRAVARHPAIVLDVSR